MPASALQDLTAVDVTEVAWDELVRSMAGELPDNNPIGSPSSCGDLDCDCHFCDD